MSGVEGPTWPALAVLNSSACVCTAAKFGPCVQQCATCIVAFVEEEGYLANCAVGQKTALPPDIMFLTSGWSTFGLAHANGCMPPRFSLCRNGAFICCEDLCTCVGFVALGVCRRRPALMVHAHISRKRVQQPFFQTTPLFSET